MKTRQPPAAADVRARLGAKEAAARGRALDATSLRARQAAEREATHYAACATGLGQVFALASAAETKATNAVAKRDALKAVLAGAADYARLDASAVLLADALARDGGATALRVAEAAVESAQLALPAARARLADALAQAEAALAEEPAPAA